MSKGNTYENDLLKLIFNATAIANLADNAASAPITNLYASLHTADPGEAGSQTTSETSYTSYARVAVARTTGGWTVTNNSVSPVATISFPACTGSSATITHFGIGTASSGTGKLLYSGVLGTNQGGFTALASNDTMTIPAITGVSVNDQMSFQTIEGQSLPTGITAGTLYYVKTVSGTAVTLSTTQGGSTLDLSADGAGYAFKHTPITVSSGVTPQLTTSTTITED